MRPHDVARLLLLGLIAAPAHAEARDSTFQEWLAIPMTYDLGEEPIRPQLWLDLHARRRSGSTLTIMRPALGLWVHPNVTVHAGYAWIANFVEGADPTRHEHRAWEQVIVSGRLFSRLALQSRTRFEQRKVPESGQVGFRFREFLRGGLHIVPDKPFIVLVWNELFLAFNAAGSFQSKGYDQNRLFGGFGVDVPGVGGRLELGYLWNHIAGEEALMNHVLYTQIVVAL